MNVRQQKYKLNRIKGMSAYRAAIEAGYAHATAWNAHKNIENRCDFNDLMIKHGLDDSALIEVLKEGLKVIGMSGKPTLTTKAYLEIALKLKGLLKEKVEHSGKIGGGTTVNVYPSKTIVFKDIDDSTRQTDTRSVHESEGAESIRPEGQV